MSDSQFQLHQTVETGQTDRQTDGDFTTDRVLWNCGSKFTGIKSGDDVKLCTRHV